MHLDFEEFRPEAPRVPPAFTRLETVLLTLLAYAMLVIAYLVAPPSWFVANKVVLPARDRAPITFVSMMPKVDVSKLPTRPADQSDLDRRAMTRERVPQPENTAPASRGNSPEKIESPPPERAAGADSPTPSPASDANAATPPLATKILPESTSTGPSRPAQGSLGQSLRNLQQYLRDENFDNQRGGDAEQGPDFQFDSMGVDFGPWLRRFKAQVERNWLVPQAAMLLKGRVVIQFYVLRNGTITEIKVVQPASVDAFNVSALNSLKLSNPTMALPPEYPADRAFFTVTFHYNERQDSR